MAPTRFSQHRLDGRIPREVRIEQVDEVLVGLPDRPRVAIQIEEADRAHVPERFPEGDIPIDLIGQGIQVKPTTGTPPRRMSWTFCHCRHSQRGPSRASMRLVSVCIMGRR